LKALLIIGLIIAVSILIDLVVVLLAKLLPPKVKSDVKYFRYESGCIPVEKPKFVLPFQYIPFVMLFLALEPIAVLLLLLSSLSGFEKFLAITLIIVIPSIALAYRGVVAHG
jgi:NADH-quinone oxidoreductase subunit A